MIRIVFGIVLGAALASGGGWWWVQHRPDCLRRCGDGTRCFGGRCIVNGPATTVATTPARKRPRVVARSGPGVAAAAPEAKLAPGDERLVAQGDALGRPEHVDLSHKGDDGRELEQEDLDAVFRPAQPRVSRCIGEALGDFPLTSGQVEVGFRVERSGTVKHVRVNGPALLMRRGLYACVRPIVAGLAFPAAGGASVVSYHFGIQ